MPRETLEEHLHRVAVHEAGHVIGAVYGPLYRVPTFVEASLAGGMAGAMGDEMGCVVGHMVFARCGPTAERMLLPRLWSWSWREMPGAEGDVAHYNALRRNVRVVAWPMGIRSGERVYSIGAYCRRLVMRHRTEILRLATAILEHPRARLERKGIADVLGFACDEYGYFAARGDDISFPINPDWGVRYAA